MNNKYCNVDKNDLIFRMNEHVSGNGDDDDGYMMIYCRVILPPLPTRTIKKKVL